MLKKFYCILIMLAAVLGLWGCSSVQGEKFYAINTNGLLTVEYIDVGQADSILITTPKGGHILIDAGKELGGSDEPLKNALNMGEVEKFDAVVATHPHYDHIASMEYIIENYEIDSFYLPDTEESYTSATYTKMLKALEENGVNTIYPQIPDEFNVDDIHCEIFAPVENKSKNCNEYSIVLKMTYGENSFLFTGDAGSESEYNMIDRGFDLSADVLKVGHHGSAYSTTREFLDEVQPEYAVISCGENNEYGHPADITLSRLRGTEIYVTKDAGSVIFTSDGSNLRVYTEKDGAYADAGVLENDVSDSGSFIGNKNSMVYHSSSCGSLPKKENRVYFSLKDDAEKEGYMPHGCVK